MNEVNPEDREVNIPENEPVVPQKPTKRVEVTEPPEEDEEELETDLNRKLEKEEE